MFGLFACFPGSLSWEQISSHDSEPAAVSALAAIEEAGEFTPGTQFDIRTI